RLAPTNWLVHVSQPQLFCRSGVEGTIHAPAGKPNGASRLAAKASPRWLARPSPVGRLGPRRFGLFFQSPPHRIGITPLLHSIVFTAVTQKFHVARNLPQGLVLLHTFTRRLWYGRRARLRVSRIGHFFVNFA